MQARKDSVGPAMRLACGGLLPFVLLFVLVVMVSTAGAQQDVNLPVASEIARAAQPGVGPYVADVIGNDVYIRSGPGTNFYHCGKLYKGDRVQVIKIQQGWSCIAPPPGCFSWIAMQYVSINLDNPSMGIVTGADVDVYAGSDYVEPMHSTSKQVVLGRGKNVRLLSEEKDDYYKIAPPEGAYLWVSSQFLKAAPSAVSTTPVPVAPPTETTPQAPITQAVARSESQLLDEYYALSKLVKEERKKAVSDQDYASIKEKLAKLAASEKAGRAGRYAGFTLKQVERFELACTVAKEIKLQSQELKKTTDKISEARTARLAQINDMGRFAVIGKLQNSTLYESTPTGLAKRYRVLDESGKTICYVSPAGAAAGKDLTGLIGRKVGLVGEIQPHQATARAFITFTEIVVMD